jgi:ABC-type multidrug transport system fused ATPase/permease subunit
LRLGRLSFGWLTINDVILLLKYAKPYWRMAVAALILLSTLVIFDLSIPRLIQYIIDEGIKKQNQVVVIRTSLIMLGMSLVSFVIAHRLSTIRDADNVIVVNEGQIVKQGSHKQLLEKRGFFYHLFMSQFKGQEI